MARWGSRLAAVAILMTALEARAQGPGFMPPMPTPAPGWTPPAPSAGSWTGPMPQPAGEPTPIGPSMHGGPHLGGGDEGIAPAGGPILGPGNLPAKEVLTLPNHPNAWDCEVPADFLSWGRYSSFTVDLLFLNSHFDRNPAIGTDFADPGSGDFATQDFDYGGGQVVPRLNLDIRVGDYFGVRGSWMRFEREADTVFTPNAFADTFFRVEVADLESTKHIELHHATGVFGCGVRYGHISQSYTGARPNPGATILAPGADPFNVLILDAAIFARQGRQALTYGHTFGGVGPKLSLELGTDMTHFARLYSKVNGSILMGNRKEIVFETVQGVAAPPVSVQRDRFTVVPVAEAEAGIEIAMGGKFFPVFRVGGFGQLWVNGGNATNPNANLFLYGVNASVGFGF